MADSPNPGPEPNEDDAPGGRQGQEPNDQTTSDSDLAGFEGLPQAAQDEVRRLRNEAKKARLERNDLRTRVKDYEDRDKSEEQRRQDELAAASGRADRAERELLRFQVAAELGISQHAGRLQGDTREALVEDAKSLAAEFGIDTPDGGGGRANFAGGVRRPVQRPKTMNDVIRQAAGR
jgi:ribosomal protein S20